MNLGGAYSSLFAGVFSRTSVLLSTASSIRGELHRARRAVCLLLVDLARAARAVHPLERENRTTNALVQLGSENIDAAARGSNSCLVFPCIVRAGELPELCSIAHQATTPDLAPRDCENRGRITNIPGIPLHTLLPLRFDSHKGRMVWRSVSTPVVAAALLGAVIALALLRQPPPRRQTKAEKRVCVCVYGSYCQWYHVPCMYRCTLIPE